MNKHINGESVTSELKERISRIENVLSCGVIGFFTKQPSVRIFFKPELER